LDSNGVDEAYVNQQMAQGISVPYGDAQLRYRMFSVGAMLWYRLQ